MKDKNQLYEYQTKVIDQFIHKKKTLCIVRMGAGKTICALTAAKHLIDREGIKVLVLAPRLVALNTWPSEIISWSHLADLNFAILHGKTRTLLADATHDLYISTFDMIPYLYQQEIWKHVDMLIIDEGSKLKHTTTKRFKTLRKIFTQNKGPFDRTLILSGILSGTGDMWEVFGQMFAMDGGETLGKSFHAFKRKYYTINPFHEYIFGITRKSKDEIIKKISSHCIMFNDNDLNELPSVQHHTLTFSLSSILQKKYKEIEKTYVLKLLDGTTELTIPHAGALSSKLRQFISGSTYGPLDLENSRPERSIENWHNLKFNLVHEFLKEIWDVSNEHFLIFYSFLFEKDHLRTLPESMDITQKGAIEKWNAGELKCLYADPRTASHGLNLQHGGRNILWLSPRGPGSYEIYSQANARIVREGQKSMVNIYTVVCANTLDVLFLKRMNQTKESLEELKHDLKHYIGG